MMTRARAFWLFAALGCGVVVLGAFVSEGAGGTLLSLLAAPGVLLSLPLHNAMPGGGWGVVALIAGTNGLVCGLLAVLLRSRK